MSSYRDITLHLTIDPQNGARTALALGMAKRFAAQVTALYTLPPPNVPYYMGEYIPTELIQRQMDDAQRASAAARDAFLTAAAAANVPHRWRFSDLSPVEALRVQARGSDLVIVGQPDPHPSDPASVPYGTDVLPQELALQAGRPVLAVPHAGPKAEIGRRILLAWNGKREAARAAHDAMPLLKSAESVTAVTVGAERKGRTPLSEIVDLLRRHGVRIEGAVVEAGGVKVGQALLTEAKRRDCDMVVMGAFGHSRLREVVFGGVTELVLDAMTVPVLLSN